VIAGKTRGCKQRAQASSRPIPPNSSASTTSPQNISQYEAWLDIATRANWRNPEEIKASYPKASILKATGVRAMQTLQSSFTPHPRPTPTARGSSVSFREQSEGHGIGSEDRVSSRCEPGRALAAHVLIFIDRGAPDKSVIYRAKLTINSPTRRAYWCATGWNAALFGMQPVLAQK
jgi:hypothetical protein